MSKIAGGIIVNGMHIADTVQCVHCNRHWQIQPGSGKTRGWCRYCRGFICGDIPCRACIPYEVKMETVEAVKENRQDKVIKLIGRYPDIKSFMSKYQR